MGRIHAGRTHAVLLAALLASASLAPSLLAPAYASDPGSEPSPATIVGLDPSARSTAMGGASGAVFWGDDVNTWANPALLGFVSGLHYQDGRTSLLADGSFSIIARQTSAGYGGVGVSLMGRPFDASGRFETDLDYTIETPYGELGEGSMVERVQSWGVGASLAGLLADAAQLRGRPAPEFTRHFDLALGYSEKLVRYDLGFGPEYDQRGSSSDLGAIARAGTTMPRGGGDAMPLRLDAAYGLSALNVGDRSIAAGSLTSPLQRFLRNSLAARAALGAPRSWRGALPAWLAPAIDPALALGVAYDAEHVTSGVSPYSDYDRRHYGAELGVTSVLTLELGKQTRSGGGEVTTWGYSIAVPVGHVAGVRFSRAVVPYAIDEGTRHLDNWSAWFDPMALRRPKP